jgi:hypothetical protein
MTTVSTIRTGLATNLATITGLRTSATMPDAINPPIAIVVPEGITFDSAMARGMDEYSFTIMVIVGRADARTSQGKVDDFCNPTGAGSVQDGDRIEPHAIWCGTNSSRYRDAKLHQHYRW